MYTTLDLNVAKYKVLDGIRDVLKLCSGTDLVESRKMVDALLDLYQMVDHEI